MFDIEHNIWIVAVILSALIASGTDFLRYRIPNSLCAILALLFLWAAVREFTIEQALISLTIASIVFVCLFGLFCVDLMAGGDVKLVSVSCLFMQPGDWMASLVMFNFLLLSVAIIILITRTMLRQPRALAVLNRGSPFPLGVPVGLSLAAYVVVAYPA